MNTAPTFKASKDGAMTLPGYDDDRLGISASAMLVYVPGLRRASSASLRALQIKAEAKKSQTIVKEGGAVIWPFSDISSVKTKSSRTLDLQISSCAPSAAPLVFTRRATAQPFGKIL
jgi:hypothetical protein